MRRRRGLRVSVLLEQRAKCLPPAAYAARPGSPVRAELPPIVKRRRHLSGHRPLPLIRVAALSHRVTTRRLPNLRRATLLTLSVASALRAQSMRTQGRRSFGKDAGRTRAHRWPAVAVSSVLLLVQALTAFHLALGRHEICPEHGEPIHVEAGIAARSPQEPPEASRSEVVRAASAPSLAQAPHEHCMVLMQRRDLLSEASSFTAAVCQQPAGGDVAFESHFQRERSELLRLAPKQSPPA